MSNLVDCMKVLLLTSLSFRNTIQCAPQVDDLSPCSWTRLIFSCDVDPGLYFLTNCLTSRAIVGVISSPNESKNSIVGGFLVIRIATQCFPDSFCFPVLAIRLILLSDLLNGTSLILSAGTTALNPFLEKSFMNSAIWVFHKPCLRSILPSD
eukprot:Lithocolla_globosa_v1_NODE_31_length_8897_cov_62.719634.p6 type:complete len:152 gc:universal NODE_31_length_8897_cov_62.719634:1122-1577(+)